MDCKAPVGTGSNGLARVARSDLHNAEHRERAGTIGSIYKVSESPEHVPLNSGTLFMTVVLCRAVVRTSLNLLIMSWLNYACLQSRLD